MIWLFNLSLAIILGIILIYSWRYGITPTPTSPKVKARLLEILPLESEIKGQIAELGSGWGTLAFAIARRFPNTLVYAYEISPIPYYISKFISYLIPYHNLCLVRQDFFTVSLNSVSLVICYLYPEAMARLKDKLSQELAPGAFVLSHTFAIPGWTPIRFIKVDDLYQTPIYLYQI